MSKRPAGSSDTVVVGRRSRSWRCLVVSRCKEELRLLLHVTTHQLTTTEY